MPKCVTELRTPLALHLLLLSSVTAGEGGEQTPFDTRKDGWKIGDRKNSTAQGSPTQDSTAQVRPSHF